MNMQYSPRTDTMVALGPYADAMRVVAQQHEIPLFDRLAIMRHWSDTGAFDLYAAGKDNVLAFRVHDCIARAMADMGPDVWRAMLCVETAAVGSSALTLAPDETHEIAAELSRHWRG
jgi:hypothetical protein